MKLVSYETMIVCLSNMDEEAKEKFLEYLKSQLEQLGAQSIEARFYGKKKLAYPVKKQVEGNYFITNYLASPGTSRAFEDKLKYKEEVIKYMSVRTKRLQNEEKEKEVEEG